MNEWPSTPAEKLVRLFRGFWVSRAIYVAAELGIADLLADGPRTVDELAAACGAHAQTLHRLLRLLASEGVFAEADDGRFELTPMGSALRSDAGPTWLQVLFLGQEPIWQAAGDLLNAVRSGETAFKRVHGMDLFEYQRQHSDERGLFDKLMAGNTAPVSRAVAAAYDFSRIGTVVDVGGGAGALAIGVLTAHPHLRGVVLDQPAVAAKAQQAIVAAGLSDRCQAVGGDFFNAVPTGGDAYMLKYILHDWDDDACVAILRVCRSAMPAGGRLLVVELAIPPGNAPSFAKTQDINMMINAGGRERTEAEYSALYAAAGFDLKKTIPVLGEMQIIEGVPA